MTGNYKSSDWARSQLIKAIKEEDSKTSSDLLRIP